MLFPEPQESLNKRQKQEQTENTAVDTECREALKAIMFSSWEEDPVISGPQLSPPQEDLVSTLDQ